MAEQRREPKQKTQPQGKDESGKTHEPVEIPVPKRKEVFDLMRGVVGKRSADNGGAKQ